MTEREKANISGTSTICSGGLGRMGMRQLLAEHGVIIMLGRSRLARMDNMRQLLGELMPSDYSAGVALGLDGDPAPEPDKPFQCADQHFTVTDDAIVEVCEAEYASYEVQRTRRPPPAIIAFLRSIREQSISVL